MSDGKNIRNYIYIGVIIVSLAAMIVLGVGFKKDKEAAAVPETATTKVALEKKENVKVTVNVETIKDGLNDMGTLITQEYYFTQVEQYTKEKKVLSVFNSSSGFTYSYDGTVTAEPA